MSQFVKIIKEKKRKGLIKGNNIELVSQFIMKQKKENTDKQEDSRYWLFKKGQSGNPKGRPKGKSLKEYSRAMLAAMTEEERQDFLKGLPKEAIWKMAEGNPKQDTDVTTQGDKIMFMPSEIMNKNEIPQKPKDNSERPT